MSAGIMQATALVPSSAHLALPFFDAAHRDIAARLPDWANAQRVDEADDRAACKDWVQRLGAAPGPDALRAGLRERVPEYAPRG